jgi:tetratricopeptide (TPR) repeat protein
MRKISLFTLIPTAILFVTFVAATPAFGCSASSLEQAKAKSTESSLPILIKVGTEWSKESQKFDKFIETDEETKAILKEHVILFSVDAKSEEGKAIATSYSVQNFPTFILTDNRGETIDRWYGFGCQDCFGKRVVAATEDLVTISERMKRFQKNPSEEDALKLGNIRHAEGMFAEAVAYFARGRELNPDSETNYDTLIFNSMAYGNYYQLYSTDQVKEQADIVLASANRSDKDLMKVAFSMYKISKRADDVSLFTPYLKASVEATADSKDKGVLGKRAKLLPEYTLYIQNNTKKAIKLKKDSMPEGWLEDGNQLNNFAWWCFENKTNLAEAEKMARRGVELTSPGRDKANVLDTLAEICNLSGECGDAVDFIRMAVAEDPENEYFQEQLIRFEKILASQ